MAASAAKMRKILLAIGASDDSNSDVTDPIADSTNDTDTEDTSNEEQSAVFISFLFPTISILPI